MKKTIHLPGRRALLFALSLCLLLSLTACGGSGKQESSLDLPDASALFYVLDEAGVLSSETENYIVSRNDALFALTGAQVVVACVNTTGTASTEEYTRQLFNTWGIGSAEKNNGVLLLLTIGEQDYWCLQGKGLENSLPSGTIKLMLNQKLEPDFAAARYDAGVRTMFDTLVNHLTTLYSVSLDSWDGTDGSYTALSEDTPAQTPEDPPSRESDVSIIAWAIIIVIVILLIISFSGGSGGGPTRRRRRTIYTMPHVRPRSYGTRMPPIRPGGSPRPGGPMGGSRPGGPYGGSRPGGSFGGSRPGGSYGGSRPGGSMGGSRPGGSFGGSRGGGGGMSRGGGAGRR